MHKNLIPWGRVIPAQALALPGTGEWGDWERAQGQPGMRKPGTGRGQGSIRCSAARPSEEAGSAKEALSPGGRALTLPQSQGPWKEECCPFFSLTSLTLRAY